MVVEEPLRSGPHKLDLGHPTWQALINHNRPGRRNTGLSERKIRGPARPMQNMTKWNAKTLKLSITSRCHEILAPGTAQGFHWKLSQAANMSFVFSCVTRGVVWFDVAVAIFLRHDLSEQSQ